LDNDCDGAIDEDGVCPPPAVHDLAVTDINPTKVVTLTATKPTQAKPLTVQIQNRGDHNEMIANATALGQLVTVAATPLVGECAAPAIALDPPKKFPVTLKPKQKYNVHFDVTFDHACDPDKTTKTDPGHDDYSYSATVHHPGGDAQQANDSCPRALVGSDKGCAEEYTDVVVK
jgi:hypothetical protein